MKNKEFEKAMAEEIKRVTQILKGDVSLRNALPNDLLGQADHIKLVKRIERLALTRTSLIAALRAYKKQMR